MKRSELTQIALAFAAEMPLSYGSTSDELELKRRTGFRVASRMASGLALNPDEREWFYRASRVLHPNMPRIGDTIAYNVAQRPRLNYRGYMVIDTDYMNDAVRLNDSRIDWVHANDVVRLAE